jgi:hypothetical protein
MKLKKKDLLEIIDTNGELIGNNAIPDVDANADTQANNTTDYNAKIGQQPFRYDMLGRFGFTLMPFMEGVEENQGQKELLNDLAKLMYDKYMETLEYYFRNPNKLKPDFRLHNEKDFNTQPEDKKKIDIDWAKKVVKVIEKHFENAFKEPENIDEAKVVEDKMVDKKDDEIASKSDDKEVREKKIEKIAGLINKLEKKDIDKLINLLERNG